MSRQKKRNDKILNIPVSLNFESFSFYVFCGCFLDCRQSKIKG